MTVTEPVSPESSTSVSQPGELRLQQSAAPLSWRRFVARGPRPAAAPLPPGLAVALWSIVVVSMLAGWFLAYGLWFSGLQQHRDNAHLYDRLRRTLSEGTVPLDKPIAPGTPIALLRFPAAALDASVVVEGTGSHELAKGPGHLRTTPMPGQPGFSVLYGRSLTFGAPFGKLHSVRKGASFSVTTVQGVFEYVVDDVQTGDLAVTPPPQGGSRLLLETSSGSVFGSSESVYLQATLKGDPVAAGLNRVSSVPDGEKEFGHDTRGLPQLIFWLQGLLAAALLAVWAALKWGRRQAWLVGLPLILGALWGVTGHVMLMLPNLI
jgi:sortase A